LPVQKKENYENCNYWFGYVGLVTGTCLADVGFEVICVDIDQEKTEQLKKGNLPFTSPV
jgi:UDPglucose 6-dehydrogenase